MNIKDKARTAENVGTEPVKFDPENHEHKLICLAAMAAADVFGAGRITACKEQLEMQDIVPYRTRAEQDIFQSCVFKWGVAV